MRLALLSVALLAVTVAAETPPAEAGPMLRFTSTTANVTGAPDSIRIDLFRWSTEAERDTLMAAWDLKSTPAARGGRGGTGGAARGAGRGRAGANAGRGAAPEVTITPEAALARVLKEAPTVGYVWSSEAAGYAVRYAGKTALPGGSERIVIITDRRLGDVNGLWRSPDRAAPAPYDFSIIELHLDAKGAGEGKLSLGEIAPDAAAGIVTLANYDSLPVVFTGLKRATK